MLMTALVALVMLPCGLADDAYAQATLEAQSDQGTFTIQLEWTNAATAANNATAGSSRPPEVGLGTSEFSVSFRDAETGKEIEDVSYSLLVDGDTQASSLSSSGSPHSVTFDAMGSHTITVADIDGLGESAVFSINVTPEFPSVPAAAIAAAAFAGMAACRRLIR